MGLIQEYSFVAGGGEALRVSFPLDLAPTLTFGFMHVVSSIDEK